MALRDDEYPEWLWSCLEVQERANAEADDVAGDEFCMSSRHSFPLSFYLYIKC